MTAIGTLRKLVLAQNVQLLVDDDGKPLEGTGTAGTDDEFATMLQVRVHKSHPESRYNYGKDRNYQHGAPDIGLSFTLSTTEETLDKLDEWSTRNTNGEIPERNYAVKYTALDGSTHTMTFKGKLRDTDDGKQRNAQQDPVDSNCFIRITSDEVRVT